MSTTHKCKKFYTLRKLNYWMDDALPASTAKQRRENGKKTRSKETKGEAGELGNRCAKQPQP